MDMDYRRIFVALDGTKAQAQVARRAVNMASENHAALCFGNVVDSVPAEAGAINFDDLCREVHADLEEALADVLAAARQDPNIPSVELHVEAGSVNETLDERLIAPFKPDLVICGERGLSNIRYAFVGSVSTHLIRTLRCDVLVVKQ